jgi:ATP-dependent DNA helicase DinG
MFDIKSIFHLMVFFSPYYDFACAQQMEMAQAIADTIAKHQILVAEAGTGQAKH